MLSISAQLFSDPCTDIQSGTSLGKLKVVRQGRRRVGTFALV